MVMLEVEGNIGVGNSPWHHLVVAFIVKATPTKVEPFCCLRAGQYQ